MRKTALWYLNFPVFVLLIAIGIAFQSSLFNAYPFNYLQPDIILLAVIWCALRRGFAEGGALTLIFANIAELHSSAPQGLFMITYMLVYLAGRGISHLFVIPNLSSLVMVTFGASIFWKLSYLFVLYLLDLAGNQWRHTLILLFPGAVMEGVIAVWVYRWLDRFDTLTFKDPRALASMEGELQLEHEGL